MVFNVYVTFNCTHGEPNMDAGSRCLQRLSIKSDFIPPRDVAPLVRAPSPGPWRPSPHKREREFSNFAEA